MLIVAGIAIVSIVTAGDDGPSQREVAVVGPQAERVAAKARAEQAWLRDRAERRRAAGSLAAARAAVSDDDADAALAGRGLVVGEDPDQALVALLQNAARVVAGEQRCCARAGPLAGARPTRR